MSLNKTGNYVNGLNTILNTFNSTGSSEAIEIFKGLNAETQKWILSSGKLSEVQIGMIKGGMNFKESTDGIKKSISGLTLEEFENAVATGGISTSQTAATGSTSSLGLAFQGLAAKIGVSTAALGAFMGVAAGIGVGIAVFKMYQQHIENVRKATQEAADTYKDASSSVDDYTSRYTELKQALEDARGNEEETYNVKKQLLDLQTELNDKFGEEYGRINLVTDAYNDQTEAIKAYNKEAANLFLNENPEGINRAKKEMNRERQYNLGGANNLDNNEAWSELKKIAESYKEKGIEIISDDYDGSLSIQLTADATSAIEITNEFMTDVRNKAKELGDEHLFDGILSMSSSAIADANSVIDDYGEIYRQSLLAEIATNDSLSEGYNKAIDAVEAYNDAVLKSEDPYNDENVAKARENLRLVKDELSTEEWKKYGSVVQEVFDEADTSIYDFNKQLESYSNLKILAKDLEGLSELDLRSLNPGENASFDKLKEWAISAGVSVDDLINALIRLGYVQGDVQSKSVSSIETLTSSYNKMKSEISATTSALSEQSTGQSISLDTYNELVKTNADYADALEYVNGAMQLNADKVKEITKAKTEETIATNEAAKAQKQAEYVENAREIETLTQKLKTNNLIGGETAETVQSQIDALKNENNTIVSTCKQIDLMNASLRESIGTYQAWKDAQNAPQSGDMFDDALTAMDDIWDIWDEKSENFMKIGTDKYKAAVEFLIPDTVDHEDMEAVKNYMKSVKKYLTWDDNGNQDGLDLSRFIQDSVDKGLMYLDETSNQYMVAGQKTMEDFATGLGLSLPFVQAIFGELEEYGAEFDWGDEVYQNIGSAVVEVDEQIQNLQDSLDYLEEQKAAGVKIDDSYIIEIKKQLEEAIALRDELCKEASAKVTTYVDVQERLDGAKRSLDAWKAELEKNPADIYVNGQVEYWEQQVAQIQEEKDQLEEPTAIEVELYKQDIDDQIDELQNKIDLLRDDNYLIEMDISKEDAAASIDDLNQQIERLQDKKGKTISIFGDTSKAQKELDKFNKKDIKDKNFDIKANIDDARIKIGIIQSLLKGIRDTNIKIGVGTSTSTSKSTSKTSSKKKEGKGPFNGTAHQSGTAHAGGNWGTTISETALVGELG